MAKIAYYTEFSDAHKNRYRVEILNDGYTGESKEMELGGDAVSISRPAKKITEPIFSMGATLQVWCNKDFEYANLFATPEQTNQVVIARNNKVIFRGWIEPNLYEEEYMAPPYLISIPAADGLSALENYYPTGIAGNGLISLLSAIKQCLNCCGFLLPINIACSLNPDNRTDNRLFEHTYVEKECLRTYKDGIYEYDNALELLESILKPFSCRIYQSGDEWYIERIKDRVSADVAWIRYATDGTSSIVTRNNAVPLDTPEYMFVNNAASFRIDAGYGKQTVKADGEAWDTVIANNFSDGITYKNWQSDYPFDIDFRSWNCRGYNADISTYKDSEIEQGVRIGHSMLMDENIRLWHRAKISANNEDEVKISFKFTIEPGSKEAYGGRYRLRIQSKMRQRYAPALIPILTLKWTREEKGNNDDPLFMFNIGADFISEVLYTVEDDWKEGFKIPIHVSATAKLGDLSKYYDLDELAFVILPAVADRGDGKWVSTPEYIQATIIGDIEVQVKEKKQYDNTFTATINRQYMRKAEDLDVRFWTLPRKYDDRPAANYNFKNGLMNNDNTAVRGLTCQQEDDQTLSVSERLLIDNFDQYYDPREMLSGEVMAASLLTPEQHISIANRTGKSYLLTGIEANLHTATQEISIEEIKPHQITIE